MPIVACDSLIAPDDTATLTDGDPRHGTANGYNNLGCRCTRCRSAWAERQRARSRQPVRPDKHGTNLNYRRGCRCDPCRLEHNARCLATKRRARERAAGGSK